MTAIPGLPLDHAGAAMVAIGAFNDELARPTVALKDLKAAATELRDVLTQLIALTHD